MVYEEFLFNNFCGYYRHFFADVSSELLHISVTKVETAL